MNLWTLLATLSNSCLVRWKILKRCKVLPIKKEGRQNVSSKCVGCFQKTKELLFVIFWLSVVAGGNSNIWLIHHKYITYRVFQIFWIQSITQSWKLKLIIYRFNFSVLIFMITSFGLLTNNFEIRKYSRSFGGLFCAKKPNASTHTHPPYRQIP